MKSALGITVITATHDMKMLSKSDLVVEIRDGAINKISTRDEVDVTVGTINGESVV